LAFVHNALDYSTTKNSIKLKITNWICFRLEEEISDFKYQSSVPIFRGRQDFRYKLTIIGDGYFLS
jgi:hypothetical protein